MNIQFQKVIEGLKCHSEKDCTGWGIGELEKSNNFCPYFEKEGCEKALMQDALCMFEKYDEALKLMVEQYCVIRSRFLKGDDCDEPDKEVLFNAYMCAGEHAFDVLGVKNGEDIPEDWD